MPKPSKFPILIDELKTLTISFLAKHKYFKRNQCKRGVVTWSRHGVETASINIFVNIDENHSYIELLYNYKNKTINKRYNLTSIPSNLGKGYVLFYECPDTLKRFKKLYLINGQFYTRPSLICAMYEKQTYSNGIRKLGKKFEIFFGLDKAYHVMNKKYFKKYYKGKPTKKYLKCLELIKESETINERELYLG